MSLLQVRDLCVDVKGDDGYVRAVDGVSFDLDPTSSMGLVGESGSGKSLTLKAVLGLLPRGARSAGGTIELRGRPLGDLTPKQRRKVCGREIAYIPQEPLTALNPVMKIGDQIAEGPRTHLGLSRTRARTLVGDLLRDVGIADPDRRADAYPHQLSGGMRQRVAIAMALSCEPAVLLADEPTTALDVTVQDQVLSLLHDVQQRRGTALVFVTHDLAVVARTCAQLTVMYAGQAVESGPTAQVLASPAHPYTAAMLRARPGAEDGGRLLAIAGHPPAPGERSIGCRFAARCERAESVCSSEPPPVVRSGSREVRCVRPLLPLEV